MNTRLAEWFTSLGQWKAPWNRTAYMPWTLIDKRQRKKKQKTKTLQSYLNQYIRIMLLQQHGL